MKTAVVTGANGFIGRNLCSLLLENEIRVIAVVRGDSSDISCLKDLKSEYVDRYKDEEIIKILFCDMEQISSLPNMNLNVDAETFFNLAWDGVSGNKRADYGLQLLNAKYEVDAVKVAKEMGCSRFIGVGSLAEQDVLIYSGTDGASPNPVSCYAAAKVAANFMSKAIGNQIGIDHIWAQIGNVYGKGDKSNNFVNFAIDSISSGKTDFTNGEQLYDFVNIKDAVSGLYAVGEKGQKNVCYYIGSGKPMILKKYIEIIRDSISPAQELHLGAIPYKGISLPESAYSCEKVYRDTGYKARIDFESGVKERILEYMIEKETGVK